MLEGRLQRPTCAREPGHPFGRDRASGDIRQEREQPCAVSRGVVSRDPQTPERMRDTLPIDHPHPLLSDFSCVHTT